ncbi:SRPBCC family protein [Cumulibacter manganitolerans]|uniref:SRPBCC family protein n=1 Tax=Cumulibacter manganitolerans TaxID=1884992 RepID=UPI0012977DD5|nr:SRPBCC family protein [Cumulibacter manganitolerans]
MPTYTVEEQLDASAENAFAYLKDVQNLPHYFPRMTKASPRENGDVDTEAKGENGETHRGLAHFHADEQTNTVTWSSAEGNNYKGSVTVTEAGSGSKLTLELDLDHDMPGIEDSMRESLQAVADNLEEDAT